MESVYLSGSEEVRRAGSTIHSAADTMHSAAASMEDAAAAIKRAAEQIEAAVENHATYMTEFAEKLARIMGADKP